MRTFIGESQDCGMAMAPERQPWRTAYRQVCFIGNKRVGELVGVCARD